MHGDTKNDNDWPLSLDAMSAAPHHHEILLENERVRVLDSLLKAGDATPVHTHRWPAVLHIIGVSDFVRFDAEGNEIFDSRHSETELEAGQIAWSPPLAPHFVRNVGDRDLRVISIELKG